MRSGTFSSLLLSVPATVFAQLVQTVAVGKNGLVYTMSSLTAPPGSQVEFQFYAHNHSVVSGSYDSPCQPDGRVFSGYMPVSTGPGPEVFVITINDTSPIWFYCAQNGYTHCQRGMVGVINPPTDGAQTLAAFGDAATRTTPPSGDLPYVVGGVVEPFGSAFTSAPPNPPVSPQSNVPASMSIASSQAVVSASPQPSGAATSSPYVPVAMPFNGTIVSSGIGVAGATPTITYSACTDSPTPVAGTTAAAMLSNGAVGAAATPTITYSACTTVGSIRKKRGACA